MAELEARPLEVPFPAVMVDEVQDITLNGLRLQQRMAGDGPNRLLLVDDGQPQVYPGRGAARQLPQPRRGSGRCRGDRPR